MAVHFHEDDLPAGVLAPGPVAVDTETMGLITPRDRLCLLQISDGQGDEHLVRFAPGSAYAAPNLKAVLADPARLKLYHFARFERFADFQTPLQAFCDARGIKGTLLAKAYDKDGQEIGRAKSDVDLQKDDADYIIFAFNERMDSQLVHKYLVDTVQ